MKVNLICSNSFKPLLRELLETRDFIIADDADLSLVEKGLELPKNGISIVFNPAEMEQFLAFLKNLF